MFVWGCLCSRILVYIPLCPHVVPRYLPNLEVPGISLVPVTQLQQNSGLRTSVLVIGRQLSLRRNCVLGTSEYKGLCWFP